MYVTQQEIIDRLPPPDERAEVERRAAAPIGEEMTLRDLRRARELTQARMAELLETGQDSVSRLEQRSDLLLSTLRDYVGAMGGRLELVARFPDRPDVILTGFAALADEDDAPEDRAPKRKRGPKSG